MCGDGECYSPPGLHVVLSQAVPYDVFSCKLVLSIPMPSGYSCWCHQGWYFFVTLSPDVLGPLSSSRGALDSQTWP